MATPSANPGKSGQEIAAQATSKAQAFLDPVVQPVDLDNHPGIKTASIGVENSAGGIQHAAFSETASVNLGEVNSDAKAVSPGHIDTIILKGAANLNGTGDQHDNLIVGNDGSNKLISGDGNDTVLTGNGADTIVLGSGDDTIIINGTGEKHVDGGAGNDHFVILDSSNSNKTFTGLNIGDRLTVTVPDGNANGELDFGDVTLSGDANSLTYTLANGSSFTLDGVPEVAATNGSVNYAVVDNGDGTWTVDITG